MGYNHGVSRRIADLKIKIDFADKNSPTAYHLSSSEGKVNRCNLFNLLIRDMGYLLIIDFADTDSPHSTLASPLRRKS